MYLTRRQFLQISGGTAALAMVGGGLLLSERELPGRVQFGDWRALPGTLLGLSIDVEEPSKTTVSIVAVCEGETRVISTCAGAGFLKIEMPCIETREESFDLYAYVEDEHHRVARSQKVEVLSRPFMFGV